MQKSLKNGVFVPEAFLDCQYIKKINLKIFLNAAPIERVCVS